MYIPLSDAPVDRPLQLVKIDDASLAEQLRRMGISETSRFMRQEASVMQRSVRVAGKRGEAVIGPGMGGKVVVHLDDDRRIPLVEMKRGESGHIEGITCGTPLQRTLETLGIGIDERITFLRALPPMDYIALADPTIRGGGRRVRIPEGAACKIWGTVEGTATQFCMGSPGKPFLVEAVLGGEGAAQNVRSYGIAPGTTMVLESVAPGHTIAIGDKHSIAISTSDGLRLFLEAGQARRIWVRESV